jgi:hypothetical protein
MTFISIHYIIICVVISWRTYETHPTLSFKSGCDTSAWEKVKEAEEPKARGIEEDLQSQG